MIALRLGLRNLFRNRWRSGLTLAAIAVAVGMMVWMIAFYEGWIEAIIRGATAVETGQVQVHTAGYIETPRVYRTFELADGQLAAVRAVPGVEAVSPRAELHGLIGNEERSQVARLVGVDPALEAATTPVADGMVDGGWLSATARRIGEPREVVLGEGLARQLRVGVGAELVVFLEAADGSLGNDLMEVVGLVRTGNTMIDRTTVYLHLGDARALGALERGVHELAIRSDRPDAAPAVAAAVAAALGGRAGITEEDAADPETLVARPWQEVSPELSAMIGLVRNSYWFLYLLLYLVAAIGVLNTQRMSALERRREFGVMIAIGMRPRRMTRTLLVETAVLGLVGAVIGATAGGLLAYYHSTAGFDMGAFTGDADFSYMGVAFSDRLFFRLDPGTVIQPVAVMLVIAVLSGFWPAIQAARTEPAPTIAGRAT